MTIVGVIGLDSPIALGELRQLLEERLLRYPRFRMRFEEGRWGRVRLRPSADFDIAQHVHPMPTPDTEQGLRDVLGNLAGDLLPEDRPPWEVHLIDGLAGGSLLVVRLHHSLADGISLIQVLVSLCDDPPDARAHRTAGSSRTGNRVAHALRIAAAAVRLALKPPDPPTSLKSPLTGRKHVSWSRTFSLATLREVAQAQDATVNDLLMSALSGALHDLLAERGESDTTSLRAMVPFNLRPTVVGQPLGNRFGLVIPELPVGNLSAASRLGAVRERMAALRKAAEGAAAYAVLNFMGFSARAVESALVWFFGRKSSLVMTNVPGPRQPLQLGGRTINRLLFWVPQAGGIAVGVSVISYAGTVILGVLSDGGSLAEPRRLVDAFEAQLEAYGAAVEIQTETERSRAED